MASVVLPRFSGPPGGAAHAGEAGPAGQQEHVRAVQAELGVGAARVRRRSDRRRPVQVGPVGRSHPSFSL